MRRLQCLKVDCTSECDDLLAPDALYETVHLILRGSKDETGVAATGFHKAGAQYDMIYTDEDKVDMDGKRISSRTLSQTSISICSDQQLYHALYHDAENASGKPA